MSLVGDFQIAGGSVRGSSHIAIDKSSQDAYVWRFFPDYIIAVVCDGCGSGRHSEVGAKIGARLIAKAIEENYKLFMDQPINLFKPEPPYPFWDRVKQDVLAQLRVLAKAMGGSLSQTVTDYFLFTTVGFLVTPIGTVTFSIGDGVFVVNGEVKPVGPFPNNEPPYIAYHLTGSRVLDANPELGDFQVHHLLKTDEVQSILIGCDGVVDFIKAENNKVPGKEKLVGPISQFYEEDRFFKNPDMVRRTLAIVNKPSQKIDWDGRIIKREKGLLIDDTTLIVVRRKPEGKLVEVEPEQEK